MHICPRCGTTLSNFEVSLGYKEVKDISATVKFELVDEPSTYVLAWTTTPWTLIGNVALAVGEEIEYVVIKTKTADQEKKDKNNLFFLLIPFNFSNFNNSVFFLKSEENLLSHLNLTIPFFFFKFSERLKKNSLFLCT